MRKYTVLVTRIQKPLKTILVIHTNKKPKKPLETDINIY